MLSEKLKKRFAKDMNLSITIFDEPYFTERLALYGMENLYSQFEKTIAEEFNGNEEAYLAYYGQVKDAAIDYIKKEGGTFEHLNKADMNNLTYKGVPVSTRTNPPIETYTRRTLLVSGSSASICVRQTFLPLLHTEKNMVFRSWTESKRTGRIMFVS